MTTGVAAPVLVALAGAISETLAIALSDESKSAREDAALYLRAIFRKASWGMRRLVSDIDASELLEEFVRQTRFNCALLQTAEKINRYRLKEIAQMMSDFPVLQSDSTDLRQSTRLFLRSIGLRSQLAGSKGLARSRRSTFTAIARDIVAHLQALLTVLPGWLAHPNLKYRIDRNKLDSAAQDALAFFERVQFSISVPPLTLREWPRLWHIISTLIVKKAEGVRKDDWSLCSWPDLYNDPALVSALTARSHIGSQADIRSHIRSKIKQKVESELGITKLKRRARNIR